jgi:cell wall-associated NlpC family hydrolase
VLVNKLAADKALVDSAAKAESRVLDQLIAQRQAEIRAAQIALAKAIREKHAAEIRRYRAERAAAIAARDELRRQRNAQHRAAEAFSQQKSSSSDSSSSTSSSSASSSSDSSSSSSGSSRNDGSIGSGGSNSGGGSGGGSDSGGGGNSGSIGSSSGSSAAATAVAWAQRELGKSYVYGAGGPDHFDCSGLTSYVYAKAGIYLPHSSSAQFGSGRHISSSDLRPGDLVFFGSPIHHVGIYVGGGQMINAPETGENVKYASIGRRDYAGAVRVSG